MYRDQLKRARLFEEEALKKYGKDHKPVFHLTPLTGWMNDPNGFSYYDGKYHLFYQYNPYDVHWDRMHWGHACTEDFVNWEYLPAALAPDQDYDAFGVFSGSALEKDGKHVLMYTSVQETKLPHGMKAVRQDQCIAIGNGRDYQKSIKNPVITGDMLPKDCSREDFRDPKIWEEDGVFYCAVGNRHEDGSGQILLFVSEDLENWSMKSVLDRCENRYGKMWECPDFFHLGEKHVLIVSPQDMTAEGLEFHNGNGTVMFTGTFDKETGKFHEETAHAVDYGLDFYAPQTVETPDGRRVMTAWLKSWDGLVHIQDTKWNGMMILPRELELKQGRVVQNPVRELEQYRRNRVSYENIRLGGTAGQAEGSELEGIKGRTADLTLDIEEGEYDSFEIRLAQNERFYSSIRYDRKDSVLTFDRTYSGLCRDYPSVRSMAVRDRKGKIRIRILLDLYSVEIFVNDGEQAMTSMITTDASADRITFRAEGPVQASVEKYDIVL